MDGEGIVGDGPTLGGKYHFYFHSVWADSGLVPGPEPVNILTSSVKSAADF